MTEAESVIQVTGPVKVNGVLCDLDAVRALAEIRRAAFLSPLLSERGQRFFVLGFVSGLRGASPTVELHADQQIFDYGRRLGLAIRG